MASRFLLLLGALCILLLANQLPTSAISSCGGPCQTLNDCAGRLICIAGKCKDDPDVGTHICSGGGGGGGSGECQQSGTLFCPRRGRSYPTYSCSPPVTSATSAQLTNNDFSPQGGGSPSECDEEYHSNSERIVALSTGWYNGGSRCNKMIRITAQNGRSTTAKVVDECDSQRGCDAEHAHLPPCENNVVDASNAVWEALGLNIGDGVVPVTWTMA